MSAALLEARSLRASVEGQEILKGVDLRVERGETHAIMGPNGSGKSRVGFVWGGGEGLEVTGGEVLFEGRDLLAMEVEERARAGVFLGFQYPIAIDGVSVMAFLKAAVNAQREARGEGVLDAVAFLREARRVAGELGVGEEMLKRYVNLGFSGGEKKRAEILQMRLLEPRLGVLDETDSGLDVDALKTVASGIEAMRGAERGLVLITHYQRLLSLVRPDRVHVMVSGVIRDSGGPELALQVEESGYAEFF